MKKITAILLFVSIVLALASCSGNPGSKKTYNEIYSEALKNTRDLSYLKLSVVASTNVRFDGGTFEDKDEFLCKFIKKDSLLTFYGEKIFDLGEEADYAKVTAKYYYDGTTMYQSFMGNNMKQEISQNELYAKFPDANGIFITLPEINGKDIEVKRNKFGDCSFGLVFDSSLLSDSDLENLAALCRIYAGSKLEGATISGDVVLSVNTSSDSYISSYTISIRAKGKYDGKDADIKTKIEVSVPYPGSHFLLTIPQNTEIFKDGSFELD
jgi:hypothetical protein